MTNVATFWRNNRLGLLYGALWSLAPIIIINLFNYYEGPKNYSLYPMQWGVCFVMVIASMLTGAAITALFRRFLRGRSAKTLFLCGPLSLLIGATLYGFLYSQLCWMLLEPTEPWGQLTLGSVIIHPAMAFFSVFAIALIPLAALNTWDLWRRVYQPAL